MIAILGIDGDSTLHRWHVDAQAVEVRLEIQSEAPLRLASLDVAVPVAQLTSGDPALDVNLRVAMRADAYPYVRFHMRSADEVAAGLVVRGELTVAGVTRPVDLDVAVTATSRGLQFTGQESIHLRDYGVSPPVFLGVLRTSEDVTVRFQITHGGG